MESEKDVTELEKILQQPFKPIENPIKKLIKYFKKNDNRRIR